MPHFNFKSLTFYGLAISFVLTLFKTVTAYGENNLTAPPSINGRYRLVFAEKVLNCNQSKALTLNIQQSGIYLNGFLSPDNTNDEKISTANENNLSLVGKYYNQKINLSGQVPQYLLCNNAHPQTQVTTTSQNSSRNFVSLQIQLVDKDNFTGLFIVNGISKAIGFTALYHQEHEQSSKLDSH